jgi:hypothetical protein
LVGNPEGNRPLGRPRCRWKSNIRMDIKEIGWRAGHILDWFSFAQGQAEGCWEHSKQRLVCHMVSSGWFPGACSLNANVSEHYPFHLHRRLGMILFAYEDGTDSVPKSWLLTRRNHTTFRTRQKRLPATHGISTNLRLFSCPWRTLLSGITYYWKLD